MAGEPQLLPFQELIRKVQGIPPEQAQQFADWFLRASAFMSDLAGADPSQPQIGDRLPYNRLVTDAPDAAGEYRFLIEGAGSASWADVVTGSPAVLEIFSVDSDGNNQQSYLRRLRADDIFVWEQSPRRWIAWRIRTIAQEEAAAFVRYRFAFDGAALLFNGNDGTQDFSEEELPVWIAFSRPPPPRQQTAPWASSISFDDRRQASMTAGGYGEWLPAKVPEPPDTSPNFDGVESPALVLTVNQDMTPYVFPEAAQGNPPINYRIDLDLPAGLAFAAATRTLSGRPTALQAATEYNLLATDQDGDTANLAFTIEVLPLDTQPDFGSATIRDISVTRNSSIGTVQLPTATGGNAPLTYRIIEALPPGIAFDANTRRLTGAPTTVQAARTYTYEVRDADGDTDTISFRITVSVPPPGPPPSPPPPPMPPPPPPPMFGLSGIGFRYAAGSSFRLSRRVGHERFWNWSASVSFLNEYLASNLAIAWYRHASRDAGGTVITGASGTTINPYTYDVELELLSARYTATVDGETVSGETRKLFIPPSGVSAIAAPDISDGSVATGDTLSLQVLGLSGVTAAQVVWQYTVEESGRTASRSVTEDLTPGQSSYTMTFDVPSEARAGKNIGVTFYPTFGPDGTAFSMYSHWQKED